MFLAQPELPPSEHIRYYCVKVLCKSFAKSHCQQSLWYFYMAFWMHLALLGLDGKAILKLFSSVRAQWHF
jgi:hypothetical protein